MHRAPYLYALQNFFKQKKTSSLASFFLDINLIYEKLCQIIRQMYIFVSDIK